MNNDGIDDILLAAPGTRGTPYVGSEIYLIFGQAEGFPASFDLNTLNGTTGYKIHGVELGDLAGFRGGGGGDINGDQIDDFAIGAIWASPSSDRLNAGQTFVLYGGGHLLHSTRPMVQPDGVIELAQLNGAHGFVINGIAAGDLSGTVNIAGDVNNDGIDDLLVGASATGTGNVYVIYGKTSFPATVELSSVGVTTNGFVIPGLATSDYLGLAIAGAGDINKDSIDDIILGAYGADPGGLSYAGRVYVIFGHGEFSARPSICLTQWQQWLYRQWNRAFDDLGYSVDCAGDVNGDGVADVMLGALGVDISGHANGGRDIRDLWQEHGDKRPVLGSDLTSHSWMVPTVSPSAGLRSTTTPATTSPEWATPTATTTTTCSSPLAVRRPEQSRQRRTILCGLRCAELRGDLRTRQPALRQRRRRHGGLRHQRFHGRQRAALHRRGWRRQR